MDETANAAIRFSDFTTCEQYCYCDPDVLFNVFVKRGAFCGAAVMETSRYALSRFSDELEALYQTLRGSASIDDMCNDTRLSFSATNRGYVFIKGTLVDKSYVVDEVDLVTDRLDFSFFLEPNLLRDLLFAARRFLKDKNA